MDEARYIDPSPLGNKVISDPVTGLERIFIPSRVENNQFIDVEAYKKRLRSSGSAELVRAWLLGDWSVTLGAFFDLLVGGPARRDAVRDPEGLAAVSLDGLGLGLAVLGRLVGDRVGRLAARRRILPRGAMVRYREWYGCSRASPMSG